MTFRNRARMNSIIVINLTNSFIVLLGLVTFILLTAWMVGSQNVAAQTLSPEYNMNVVSQNIVAQANSGTGTIYDPFIIENKFFKNLPGNGILVSNIDANIIIRNIATENLGLSNNFLNPIGICIQGSRNVQIENYTAHSGEILRVSDSQNIKVKDYRGRNLFFEGVNESTIDNCTSDNIIIMGSMISWLELNDSSNILKNLKINSENCFIKNCKRVGEMDLFDAKKCVIENCHIEDGNLWLVNPTDLIFRNITAVNSTLRFDWAQKIAFENMSLAKSEISMEGYESENFQPKLSNCTVDGKPIYCYQNRSNLMLDNFDAGHIWLVNCPRSRINSSKLFGVFVINSSNVIIENSKIGRDGINLAFSKNCIILNNTMPNSITNGGITQYTGCHNNTINHKFIN